MTERTSTTLIAAADALRSAHAQLTKQFVEFYSLMKAMTKHLNSVSVASTEKEPELTPEKKRAKATAQPERLLGTSLSNAFTEARPTTTGHDHGLTAQTSLEAHGTMLGKAARSHDESLTEILSTIDLFQDELEKSSVISAGMLEASNPGH